MATFGEKLKYLVNLKYSNFNRFASDVDVQLPNLYKYFNDEREPGLNFLRKLFELGFDVHWLISKEHNYITNKNNLVPSPEINHISQNTEFSYLANIPAGRGEITMLSDWIEKKVLNISPHDHFLLRIDEEFGWSMKPILKPGDFIVASTKQMHFNNGDIVAARWDKTKGAIKILNINKDDKSWIALHSANPAEEPIFLRRTKVQLFKVVAWFDKGSIKDVV